MAELISNLGDGGRLSRSEMAMVATAVRNRWPVPESVMQMLPKLLAQISTKKDSSDRDKIAASRALIQINQQNIDIDTPEQSHSPVVNVGVKVENSADTGGSLARQVAERIRADRLLEQSPG